MSRRSLLRVGMLAVIVVGLVVVVLRERQPDRDGWIDCTAPQVQDVAPIAERRPRVALDAEVVRAVPQPVAIADAGDRLLAGSLTGEVTDLSTGNVILDLSDEVIVGSEQGLLDIELDPEREWLYVSYTEMPDGDSKIRAWRWESPELVLDEAAGTTILHVEQPHRWHNGGGIVFGPDGYLYIGLGDGGSDDPGGTVNARDLSSVLGSILRIDPRPQSGGYEVPESNPFVGSEEAAPEILHYGLRNPWRFSFDSEDRLWIADVGQYCVEEINVVGMDEAGVNFGWPGLEGTYEWAYPAPENARPPVFEYLHVGMAEEKAVCSISGGEVYRGDAIPELRGAFVFADFCDGGVRAIRLDGETVVEYDLDLVVESPVAVVSDDEGALYIASFQEGGSVLEIVPG